MMLPEKSRPLDPIQRRANGCLQPWGGGNYAIFVPPVPRVLPLLRLRLSFNLMVMLPKRDCSMAMLNITSGISRLARGTG